MQRILTLDEIGRIAYTAVGTNMTLDDAVGTVLWREGEWRYASLDIAIESLDLLEEIVQICDSCGYWFPVAELLYSVDCFICENCREDFDTIEESTEEL